VKEAIMSHSDTIGGERPAGGEPSGLGARLGRFFSPANSPQDQLQETVEFTPEDVVPAEEAWAPRFTTVWRGYDRASVDEYIGGLEDELATVRAEHTPEHAIQDEIDRLGNDTAEILRVAHAKADAIASRAHAQADLLMAEAQAQAEATTRDAEARRRTFDADADLIWRERTRLIDDSRKLADCMLSVADDAVERFPPETVEPVEPAEATNGQAAAGEAPADGPAPGEPGPPPF
jgi:DivIVA domain-containing protein